MNVDVKYRKILNQLKCSHDIAFDLTTNIFRCVSPTITDAIEYKKYGHMHLNTYLRKFSAANSQKSKSHHLN